MEDLPITEADSVNLLGLPTELLEQILYELPSSPDILKASLTCRQVRAIAEPLFYKSITLQNPRRIQMLNQKLSNDPNQASRVTSFTIDIPRGQRQNLTRIRDSDMDDQDAQILRYLPNLEHLMFKSPWPSLWELPRLFDQILLLDEQKALQQELAKYVKQEDEHKFRCKVPECAKLFKEHHFWRKHVAKRHPEWFEALKRDLELVNTWVLDPAHTAPSRSDANSNDYFLPTNGYCISRHLKTLHIENLHPHAGDPNLFRPGDNRFGSVFHHPCLESVTFIHTRIEVPDGYFESQKRSSPIKKLRIINCNWDIDTTASIIDTIHSLEELVISEDLDIRYYRWFRPSVPEWMTCIGSAKHTLKKLVLEDNNEISQDIHRDFQQTPPPLPLGKYTSLTHLEISYDNILPENYEPEYLPDIFPPNLVTLKFLRVDSYTYPAKIWDAFLMILQNDRCLQKLERIVLQCRIQRTYSQDLVAPFEFPPELIAACETRGVELLKEVILLKPIISDSLRANWWAWITKTPGFNTPAVSRIY